MVEMIPTDADNIIGFRFSGKFEDEDFEMVTELMEKRLEDHDKLRVYAEVESFKGIALMALLRDIAFSLKHFRDFEKEAVISDNEWIGKLARMGDKIIPTIEVRHFPLKEKEEALEWLKH